MEEERVCGAYQRMDDWLPVSSAKGFEGWSRLGAGTGELAEGNIGSEGVGGSEADAGADELEDAPQEEGADEAEDEAEEADNKAHILGERWEGEEEDCEEAAGAEAGGAGGGNSLDFPFFKGVTPRWRFAAGRGEDETVREWGGDVGTLRTGGSSLGVEREADIAASSSLRSIEVGEPGPDEGAEGVGEDALGMGADGGGEGSEREDKRGDERGGMGRDDEDRGRLRRELICEQERRHRIRGAHARRLYAQVHVTGAPTRHETRLCGVRFLTPRVLILVTPHDDKMLELAVLNSELK
ncbi:hypothetical protein DEU56DRAFT_752486 [Suillus clintonianus]|uniref:uncharacterized protein n=1 Tax=Suillus clintonianus TaxID=1904413 RepID=UPI001B87B8A5|nr:uncharacterized protein DEU56DRAFT_752486 [Suillus clintonianus]KAG2150823.1 hypothetical protein DEU56DRAFT_752486 [Suillus clintonianus]